MGNIIMIEQHVKTQHVTQFSWSVWKGNSGIPDLAPSSVEGSLLLSIRDATEMAAGEIIGYVVRKAEKDGVAYTGPKTLADLFEYTFSTLNGEGIKMLKKSFDTVLKNYYTVIFQDPSGKNEDFLAYASPGMYYDLVELVKHQGSVDKTGFENEMAARLAQDKCNACIKNGDVLICGQPISGRTLCKHWAQPEEGNLYQCYFQDRNPNQVEMRDAFLCLCEAAWNDSPTLGNKQVDRV